MISRFTLHDLRLLAKLQKEHVSLCPMETLTHPQTPVWAAIVSLLPFDEGQSLTLIYRPSGDAKEQPGFLQARQPPARPTMYLQRLTPPLGKAEEAQAAWSRLINYAVTAAGERGIQRIFAYAGNESAEKDVLSTMGFSVYAREDIYRLAAASPLQHVAPADVRPEQSSDYAGISRLYRDVTPHRAQLAESPTELSDTAWLYGPMGWSQGEGFVLQDRDGVSGYGYFMSGRVGHWLQILVHPRAYDRASDLLDYGLALLDFYPPLSVYCGVREYQGGVRVPLEERGFQMFSAQCCMVRHTMARVKKPALNLVPALEKRVEAPTTTLAPTERTQWNVK